MRLLIFHGYLLHGTGSNVYNARLARALGAGGHDVDLLCQELRPEEVDGVDAIGDPITGAVRVLREPVRVTAWRPAIGPVLPVYVADRYEGVEAVPFTELGDEAIEAYVRANVEAVRAVVARARPDVALANHLVMGPRIFAEALEGSGVPYAVKIHGSALEYTVKRDPARFLPAARAGLRDARAVLVGSRHTAESLWATVGEGDGVRDRTVLGPPGVDVEHFRPRPAPEAAAEVRRIGMDLSGRPPSSREASAFTRDERVVGAALAALALDEAPYVLFTGKLIVSKGVDLLIAAWPLVLMRHPDARLAIAGFGGFRPGLLALREALALGDLDAARALAGRARELETGTPGAPLRYLQAFLADPDPGYRHAAEAMNERVEFVGRLEHDELAPLLAACDAQVVPSTFPEAFGMVAAEAAACGTLPIVAGHSGLAEVAARLAEVVPQPVRELLAFDLHEDPVRAIAGRVVRWLDAEPELRAATSAALVSIARERYSWDGVADGVVAAAEGRLEGLPRP